MKIMKILKRPWGEMKQFAFNEKCTVKLIELNAFEELSLQKHKHRKEMWYFLTSGFVQVGKKRRKVKEGEVVIIGKNTAHRLFAMRDNVKVLEISFGKFDEKDEIRLEDKYNRL